MAYEIAFQKSFEARTLDDYINPCCWGGDVIRDRLLPLITHPDDDVMTMEEDWGWFIWTKRPPYRYSVDIFCDDPDAGEFRIHVYAHRKKWLFFQESDDGPELDALMAKVKAEIDSWAGECKLLKIER